MPKNFKKNTEVAKFQKIWSHWLPRYILPTILTASNWLMDMICGGSWRYFRLVSSALEVNAMKPVCKLEIMCYHSSQSFLFRYLVRINLLTCLLFVERFYCRPERDCESKFWLILYLENKQYMFGCHCRQGPDFFYKNWGWNLNERHTNLYYSHFKYSFWLRQKFSTIEILY